MTRLLVNEAMRIERQTYLGARPFERTPERSGRANGYKPKKVKTRLGEIVFDIPQVREAGFYPGELEKGQRSEWALTLTRRRCMCRAFPWPGPATRTVAAINELLCGTSVSSTQASRAAAPLDEGLEV
jgi:putative transposase